MKLSEIRNILEQDLRPKYEQSRDTVIFFVETKAKEYLELLSKASGDIKNIEGRKIYDFIFDSYNEEIRRKEKGAFFDGLSKEHIKLIEDSRYGEDFKKIAPKITNKYEKALNSLLDDLVNEIKKHNPKNLELGFSEHDFNFILELDNCKRSFTINTIIASGDVQCVHYRTLRKLHKGVV